MGWLDSFFAWPGGGVWPNLVASALTTIPALAWHHRKMKQHITDTLAPKEAPDDAVRG
jgi:hypothetical protein